MKLILKICAIIIFLFLISGYIRNELYSNPDEISENKIKTTKSVKQKISNDDVEMSLYANQKKVIVHLEKNKTVTELLEVLPDEFQMEDLHGNEKYLRLSRPITSNETVVNRVKVGDVMLYRNDTLVVFYKNFSTQFAYTRIGYIEGIEKQTFMKEVFKIQIHR